jgi:hypothetical protein
LHGSESGVACGVGKPSSPALGEERPVLRETLSMDLAVSRGLRCASLTTIDELHVIGVDSSSVSERITVAESSNHLFEAVLKSNATDVPAGEDFAFTGIFVYPMVVGVIAANPFLLVTSVAETATTTSGLEEPLARTTSKAELLNTCAENPVSKSHVTLACPFFELLISTRITPVFPEAMVTLEGFPEIHTCGDVAVKVRELTVPRPLIVLESVANTVAVVAT